MEVLRRGRCLYVFVSGSRTNQNPDMSCSKVFNGFFKGFSFLLQCHKAFVLKVFLPVDFRLLERLSGDACANTCFEGALVNFKQIICLRVRANGCLMVLEKGSISIFKSVRRRIMQSKGLLPVPWQWCFGTHTGPSATKDLVTSPPQLKLKSVAQGQARDNKPQNIQMIPLQRPFFS